MAKKKKTKKKAAKKTTKKKVTKKKATKKKVAKKSTKKKTTKKKAAKKKVTKKKAAKKKTTKKATKKKVTKKKAAKKKATKKKTIKKSTTVKKAAPKKKTLSRKRPSDKPQLGSVSDSEVHGAELFKAESDLDTRSATPALNNEAPADQSEQTVLEDNFTSLDEAARDEGPHKLSDEYNPDDETEDDEVDYGWEYNTGLDDPETADEEERLLDEDERYALGLDDD